jgi:phosphate acetyltransferase
MTSADTERPYLQIIKGVPGLRTVSSCFVMEVPDCEYGNNGLFVYADCGMIIDPSVDQLVDIAYASTLTAVDLCGMEPRVAFVSASTKGSISREDHPIIEKVVRASELFRETYPNIVSDGEIQIDAALIPQVCRSKAPDSPFAEEGANVLVFPDLNAGNSAYKMTQRLAKADAFGPVLQGIALPCHDLSRGATADEIATMAAIASVQASKIKNSGERESRILKI